MKFEIRTTLILLVAIFYMGGYASADAQSEITIKKNSISMNILGTGTYFGVSYERLLSDRIIGEIGIGIIGYGIGATLYPLKNINAGQVNPFIGLKYTNHAIPDGEHKSASYLPIGLTYFSKNNMNISFDIGPSYFNHKSAGYMPIEVEFAKFPYSDFGFWGNFKVGFRF